MRKLGQDTQFAATNAASRATGYSRVLFALFSVAFYSLIMSFALGHSPETLRSSALCDAGGDGSLQLWNVWWVGHSLGELHSSPYQCGLLWYPDGHPLYFDSFTPINGLLAMPMLSSASQTVTYNLLVFQAFVFSGVFFSLFCLEYVQNWGFALLGGLLYMLSPFHVTHAPGHLQLITTQFVPIFLLFWKRGLESGRVSTAFFAALSLETVLFSDPLFFLYCIVIAGVLCLATAIQSLRNRIGLSECVRFSCWSIGFSAVFAGPILWGAVQELLSHKYTAGHEPSFFSSDLFSYLVPGEFSRWGGLSSGIWKSYYGFSGEHGGTMGIIALFGMFQALRLRWQQSRLWIILGLAFFFLSLGPTLRVLGQDTKIPMPYLLLEQSMPISRILGTPVRFSFVVQLCIALLAAIGYEQFLSRFSNITLRRLLLFCIIAVGLLELWPKPFQVSNIQLTPEEIAALEAIRAEPGDFAILTAPSHENFTHKYLQTYHQRPMIGGFTSRTRLYPLLELSEAPLLGHLYGRRDMNPNDLPIESKRTIFGERRIRFILCVDRKYDELIAKLGTKLEFASERFRIYRVLSGT